MMASATESTITMAVAADSPPTKASSVMTSAPADSGSASTNMSASNEPLGRHHEPGCRNGHHEQVDQHEIDRKQPGGAADLLLGVVLHHRDVELARQQHDAHQAEERDGDPEAAMQALRKDFLDLRAALLRAL